MVYGLGSYEGKGITMPLKFEVFANRIDGTMPIGSTAMSITHSAVQRDISIGCPIPWFFRRQVDELDTILPRTIVAGRTPLHFHFINGIG